MTTNRVEYIAQPTRLFGHLNKALAFNVSTLVLSRIAAASVLIMRGLLLDEDIHRTDESRPLRYRSRPTATKRIETLLTRSCYASAFLMFGSSIGMAADVNKPQEPIRATPLFDTSYGFRFMSDYVARGLSNSNGHASVQTYGEIRTSNGLYLGGILSTVDFPKNLDLTDPPVEIDLLAGWRGKWDAFSLDVGGIYVYYPNEDPDFPSMNTWEIYLLPSYTIGSSFTVTGGLSWSNDYGGTKAPSFYTSLSVRYILPVEILEDVTTSISGEFGHLYWGVAPAYDLNIPDYDTWNAGVSFTHEKTTLDLRYHDSTLNKDECKIDAGGSDWCGARFVATLSLDF